MRILRPYRDGYIALTEGEALLSCLFRGLFALFKLMVLTLWWLLAVLITLIEEAWRRYRAYRDGEEPPEPDTVIPFKRRSTR